MELNSFLQRGWRAIGLQRALFEEVEHDTRATWQAAAVVALGALSVGFARHNDGIMQGILVALAGWLVYSLFAYFAGTRLLPSKETSATPGEVLRTLGFAAAPLVLWFLTPIPLFGGLIALVLWVMWAFATILGLKASMELDTVRAVGVGIVALVMYGFASIVLGLVFGADLINIGV